MKDMIGGWKRFATAAMLAAACVCGASAGDFTGSTKNGPLVILDSNGNELKKCFWNDSERSLDGTGLLGTVVDAGDRWRMELLGGTLAGRIFSNAGLEIVLGGGETGISSRGGSAIEANGGLRIVGPGVLHIDQHSERPPVKGGGRVAVTLGAAVGINSLGGQTGIIGSGGVRVLASALHVNAPGAIGIDCGTGGLEVSESILTVVAGNNAVYADGTAGRVSVAASSVHLVSSTSTALQCGTGIIAGAEWIAVANSVFCALGAGHGIYACGSGSGATLQFDNVVGAILGGDCGISPAGRIFVGGGSTKLSVAGNVFGEHSPDDADAWTLLAGDGSSGQAIRLPHSSQSYFGLEAGSVKLFSPGSCGLVCATNAVTGGSLEVSGEASYGDFQTLFTWAGAMAAAEIVAGKNLFAADGIVADYFETQAFTGLLGPTAALFAADRGRPITGIKADMLYVDGGKVSVEASGTGILLGGRGSPLGYLTLKSGEIGVDAGLVAIMDGESAIGYTTYTSDVNGIWIAGGRLAARGGLDGILTCGYVFQQGGTADVAATGGHSAGEYSGDPGLAGYAVGANNGFAIEGGSFVARGGEFRQSPNTTGNHGFAAVHPCDLAAAGNADGTPVAVGEMVPSWYGVNDLYPIDGVLRFWLPEGAASLACGGRTYTANGTGQVVAGSNRFVADGVPATLVSLSVSGPASVPSGGTAAYSCTATDSEGNTSPVSPEWSIPSGQEFGRIDADGMFTAAVTATGGSVVVRAEYGGLAAEKAVEVRGTSTDGETECRVEQWKWQDGTWRVVFPVADGKLYRLQRAGTLGGVWVTIARLKAFQDGRVSMPDSIPAGTARGFYRLAEGEETAKDLYMVVDMSGGPGAAAWPVEYLDAMPDGGWRDEYKTSKLVLRRIEPGTFAMGSPETELGRDDDETLHDVTLSEPYYLGVFEVTQRQWELATGARPGFFSNETCYTTRPVESVSFADIRGAEAGQEWPASDGVDADSFLGVVRAKTGLPFTLPTEARWEYACRAGADTALNSGLDLASTNVCPHLAAVGRYLCDGGEYGSADCDASEGTAAAGSYAPNAWGLYDMHGNVWEWCLDWLDDYPSGAVVDPAGPAEASARYNRVRVIRGGSGGMEARACRSAARGGANADWLRGAGIGLRLCCGAPSRP